MIKQDILMAVLSHYRPPCSRSLAILHENMTLIHYDGTRGHCDDTIGYCYDRIGLP